MSWETQGRQNHGWFGHGTGPGEEKQVEPAKPGSLFNPLSFGQRVDYATGSVVGHSPRDQQSRWSARVGGENRERLRTVLAVWYGASKLDRETFRQQLLDPLTNDKTVDRLRSAAKGIVEGETYARLNAAGDDLATAAQTIGLDRWPQFLGNAERRDFAAVSDGMIPGVVKASATGTDIEISFGIGLGLVLLTPFFKTLNSGPARPSITPTMPSNLPQEKPGDGKSGSTQVAPSPTPKKEPDDLAQPGDATLAEDRRKYILDGNGRGGGGHGPGRATPGKSTFPPDWSDEKAIEAVKEVANDPASVREPADGGRTAVTGTRDGVKIEVIIGRDRKEIITAYPIEAGSEKK